jgi:hypothetical protein
LCALISLDPLISLQNTFIDPMHYILAYLMHNTFVDLVDYNTLAYLMHNTFVNLVHNTLANLMHNTFVDMVHNTLADVVQTQGDGSREYSQCPRRMHG